MNSEIKFSIILNCYNLENIIENAIESIKKQSFEKFECIIVDDCSTDNSVNIINKSILNDNRFKLLQNEKNMSLFMSRRFGVRQASGEYILFLDGDDIFFEDAFKKINDFINSQKESCDVIEFAHKTFPDGISFIPKILNTEKSRLENFADENIFPNVWKSIYKTDFLKNIESQLPDEYLNIGEDFVLQTIVSYYAKNYTYSDIFIVKYFLGIGMSTKKASFYENEVFVNSIVLVQKILSNFFKAKNEPNGSIYLNKIIQRFLRYYIRRCMKDTYENEVYKSLSLVTMKFDEEMLRELYPFYMFGPESINNAINYYGRKKMLIEIAKKSLRNIKNKVFNKN